jgi:hypothetical protein
MRVELKPHPDTPSAAVTSIEADVERTWQYGMALTFRLRGDLAGIRFPPRAEPDPIHELRRDGLWQTTCFEAFLRDPGSEGYLEFNYSPSTAFAIYEFERYRAGMQRAYCSRAEISTTSHGERFELSTAAGCQRSFRVRGDGPLLLGLSAVIEETSGAKSYWALAHPPGRPDFHHADGFALMLDAP